MPTTPTGSVHSLGKPFTFDMLNGFTDGDIGRTITIKIDHLTPGPLVVEAILAKVGNRILPLFTLDEAGAESVIKSITLENPARLPALIVEVQCAIRAMRVDLEEIEHFRSLDNEPDLKTRSSKVINRSPQEKRRRRLGAMRKAANNFNESVGALTELDKHFLGEISPIDRARLEDTCRLLDQLIADLDAVAEKFGSTRGAPVKDEHFEKLVFNLAMLFEVYTGEIPAQTYGTHENPNYPGPFERFVAAVVKADGDVEMNTTLDYQIRKATERLGVMLSKRPETPA